MLKDMYVSYVYYKVKPEDQFDNRSVSSQYIPVIPNEKYH